MPADVSGPRGPNRSLPEARRSLANERTALGWQRSALSLAVIAALVLGHALHRGEPLGAAAAVVPALAAAGTGLHGRALYSRRTLVPGSSEAAPLRALAFATALVALLAAGVMAGGSA